MPFDIIALSKEKPHRVALIELKYGKKALGGKVVYTSMYQIFINFKKGSV